MRLLDYLSRLFPKFHIPRGIIVLHSSRAVLAFLLPDADPGTSTPGWVARVPGFEQLYQVKSPEITPEMICNERDNTAIIVFIDLH